MVNPLKLLTEYFTVRMKNGLIYYDMLEFAICNHVDPPTLSILKMVLRKHYGAFSSMPDEKRMSAIRINFLSEPKRL
jgi:hypothetical protein